MADGDYNSQYVQDQTGRAEQAANEAYQQGMLQFQNEQLAFQKAQQAWKEVMDRAGLTGMYEGQFTMPVQQWQAETFGTWGAPAAGQQTLGGQQQQWQQAFNQAQAFGQWYAPGTAPTAGQQTQAAQQQQWAQGFAQQQEANRQAQLQQQNAQQYLQLLSSLRGPADWAKYQQVLGATPGGMRDLAAAAMGQYIPGGGATTGVQPQAVNLQTMLGQIQQGGYGQASPYNAQQTWNTAAQATAPSAANQTLQQLQGGINPQYAQQRQQQVQAMGQQPAGDMQWTGGGTNAYGAPATSNQQAGQMQYQVMPRSGQGFDANMQPIQAQQRPQTAWGSGGTQQQQQNLPAPNQIAPQAWKNMAPSQQQMLLGQYEAEGWHKPDVEALFAQSLPKYAANAPTAGTFRLR